MKTLKAAGAVDGFLFFAFQLTNCKKEYSYEGGKAEFSLLLTNGACANFVLSGDYIKDVTLGPSNTVQWQVYVTTAGRFSLQTNSRDGFQFSASGTFSDTRVQTLTMTANARPDSSGTVTFFPEMMPSYAIVFEVSGQPVQQAGYTIIGAPDACTNVRVLGVYQKDKLLTGSNMVVVNVNVISPGDYTIQTDTLEGISFFASGHFAQAGNQVVTLTGSGTPLLPQNLQFTLSGNGSACTFPLTVDNTGNAATYVIASGVDQCVGLISGNFIAGTPLDASNTYTLTVYVTVVGNFNISTQTANGITFYYTSTFTRLGTQFVTLTVHGIHVNVGTFTLTPEIVGPAPLGGNSCAFMMTVK